MLDQLGAPSEIRDTAGQVIGLLTPAVFKQNTNDEVWSAADLEEAEKMAASEVRGYTLKEVWEHIHAAHDQLISVLRPLAEPTEIRGSAGQLIGVFTPDARRPVWSEAEIAEAERVLAEEGHLGRPLADIWRDLHQRETPQ